MALPLQMWELRMPQPSRLQGRAAATHGENPSGPAGRVCTAMRSLSARWLGAVGLEVVDQEGNGVCGAFLDQLLHA